MVAEVLDALARNGLEPKQGREGITAACPVCRTGRTLRALTSDGTVTCSTGCERSAILAALGIGETATVPGGPPPGVDGAQVVCIADVRRERVEWLWGGRIPLAKLTLLDGDPKLGKSTLTVAVAAAVTTGRPLPGDTGDREPAGVVLVSLEDGVGDTIRPRLEAAGADLRRAHVITGMGEHGRTPTIPDDLLEIERVVLQTGARLVVVDPLMAALAGEVNAHRDQDVRRALAPLAAMAQRTGAAVVIVRHLRKSEDGPAIYRGGGSIGIIGAARAALLVTRDPDATAPDDPRRVLAVTASNLAREAPALRWSLVASADDPDVAVVAWGETCALTPDQLLARPDAEEAGALGEAGEWLRAELAAGPRPPKEVQAAARKAGIAWRTIERAKGKAGVISRKDGFDGVWVWALAAKNAKAEDLAAFAKSANGSESNSPIVSTKTANTAEDRQRLGNGSAVAAFDDVLWRVEAMRAQVPAGGGALPYLMARPGPRPPGTCPSCGDPVAGGLRCPPCLEAVQVVTAEARGAAHA